MFPLIGNDTHGKGQSGSDCDREIEFAGNRAYLPFHGRRHVAETGRAMERPDIVRQVDQHFQARRDTGPPAAVGAVEYVGTIPPADVDAVFVLQTADRRHDGRIGGVGPIGFDRVAGLRALLRRRRRGA